VLSRRVQSLGEQAYEKFVEALQDGVLTPDSRILEADLVAWLGMSRTPVREALQRLVAEGVLAYSPRGGMTAVRLDQARVIELYSVREALEGVAAAFAAMHALDSEIIVLKDLSALEAVVLQDPVQGARHNSRFHRTLYRISHNDYLLHSLRGLTTSLALLGNYTRHIEGRAEQARQEHTAIVDAIAARDPKKAEEIARAHIRSALKARLEDMSGLNFW
jgi:DNA-binding GntR family transcriptional regulator